MMSKFPRILPIQGLPLLSFGSHLLKSSQGIILQFLPFIILTIIQCIHTHTHVIFLHSKKQNKLKNEVSIVSMTLLANAWFLSSDYSKTHWEKLLYIHRLHFFSFHSFFHKLISTRLSSHPFLKPLFSRLPEASFYSVRSTWYRWQCSPYWNTSFTCLPEHHTFLVLLS